MNKNEYGGAVFKRTEDGKKELEVSDKASLGEIIDAMKENAADPGAERIDQIKIVDYENGEITKKVIYADHNKPQKKISAGGTAFAVGVVVFIAAVAIFLIFAG